MTYKSFATDGTLAQGIVDSIVNDAVALGYSCVESRYQFGDLVWSVIKNPASLNYFQSDWHMALGYQDSNKTNFYVSLFENWNTSSKMATAQAPGMTTSWAPTGSYTCGRSPAMLNSGFAFVASSREIFTMAIGTVLAGDQCYYSITEDRLMMGVCINSSNSATRGSIYVGAYERFLPSSLDPVPICITRFPSPNESRGNRVSDANSSQGSSTREPGQTVYATPNFSAGYGGENVTYITGAHAWTPMGLSEYQRRDSDYSANELYSGKPMVSRIPVVGREQNGLRGLFIGAYFIGSPLKEHGTEAVWRRRCRETDSGSSDSAPSSDGTARVARAA